MLFEVGFGGGGLQGDAPSYAMSPSPQTLLQIALRLRTTLKAQETKALHE